MMSRQIDFINRDTNFKKKPKRNSGFEKYHNWNKNFSLEGAQNQIQASRRKNLWNLRLANWDYPI